MAVKKTTFNDQCLGSKLSVCIGNLCWLMSQFPYLEICCKMFGVLVNWFLYLADWNILPLLRSLKLLTFIILLYLVLRCFDMFVVVITISFFQKTFVGLFFFSLFFQISFFYVFIQKVKQKLHKI